jgi:hypothetical protein
MAIFSQKRDFPPKRGLSGIKFRARLVRPATWLTTPLLQQLNHLDQCAPKLKNSAPLGKGKVWEINAAHH